MPTRILALLAVLVLALAACADDDATEAPDETLDDAAELDLEGEPAPDVDLDDDTAATVNGTEIAASTVDDRVDSAIEADEELATHLEGEEGEQLLDMFRAQTLTVLVQTQIIFDGAEELGVEPSEEDVEEAREELVAELGGEDEFAEAIEASGMSQAALDDQLRGIAALHAIGERLLAEGAADELPEQPEGAPEQQPEDLVVQQWLGERVAQADVVVHPSYGQWDPQSGQVMPAGGPMMPAPEEGEELELDE